MEIKDSVWVRSKTDSMLQIAWMNDSSSRQNIFATQKQFKIQNIPFVITVVWEAKKLNAVFAELPLGEGYFASIQSATSVLMQNTSSFKARELTGAQESAMTEQTVRQNESNWKVLIGAFQTVQLWIVIAVPEKTVLKPLEDFLLYSTISIIGTAFVMLCLGWMLSFQIKRPIAHLVKDVQRLSKFDFTQTIQIPAMKDLRGMAEAIELLRQALERNKPLLTKSNNAGSYVTGENSILPNSSPLQTSPRLIEFLNPPEPKTIQWHPSIILTAPEVNRSESYNVSYEWRKGPTLIGYGKTIEAPLNAGKNVYLLKALDQDDVGVQPAEVEIVINCE
jgi:HAMP domain-containing protein